MDDTNAFKSDSPPLSDLLRIDTICDRFELELRAGKHPTPEDYLGEVPETARPALLEQLRAIVSETNEEGGNGIEQGSRIGRYRIERIWASGGFGRVYLAHDDQLQRLVAIEVPHRKLVDRHENAEAYLTEARTVANLDHPNIVPVFDVGSTEDCPCYVVSKHIDGTDLASRLKQSRLSIHEAVELVVTVAGALHHAHKQGLVHRDIKPGNILLDKSGKPFVADFGLALREQDVGKGPRYAGTPAYMSPEQARGEGHRVDGRSDIFSLGVVFYKLLVGGQPFQGDSRSELMEQITSFEPRPPRQIDDTIPKELERICLKSLSKRASERYMTAKDMADDLGHFLAHVAVSHPLCVPTGVPAIPPPMQTPGSSPTLPATLTPTTPVGPSSDSHPIKIVPKGLRSFDAHDAAFFLELLPGPRDREGLPDSLRFWKTRIEETDADNTFSVGLIYGPSGCGKSSQVKAGLLPRLTDDVITVYVEATAEETESRILNGLRKRCPALTDILSLKETLAALRRGQGIPGGKKVLIVLDQFEQWLHARTEEQDTELVQALRQCDGSRVQCVVMVRDDFWMAATRFMRELEVRLVEGQNSAAADLFDLDHAKKVLAAFGRAFGKLPQSGSEASKEQKEFLKQAVSGLAQEGKIICVRLALFTEMMRGKAWTPATLKEVGGTEGVGVTFLEETFSAATAPPEHRYHQRAARSVLKALLPESGADIKGHMRSYAELLDASGFCSRPKDFDDLIRILDPEIRLITPTDPEGKQGVEESTLQVQSGQKYYQLTHDYLVHSLRDWLTRKQKETRRGRAELLLADRAAVWNARPENRQLPSLLQWIQVKWLTGKKNWTPPQRKMMSKASRYHALRGLVVTLVLVALSGAGLLVESQIVERSNADHAAELVQRLLDAETQQVPGIVTEMEGYRPWAAPLLTQELSKRAHEQASEDEKERLGKRQAKVAVALLHIGKADNVWQLLQLNPDPRVRSYLIHWVGPVEIDPQTIMNRLEAESDVTIRRALVLTLGEFTDAQLPVAKRQPLIEKLQFVYENEPDAGLHGAAAWLLRKWEQRNRLQAVVEKLRSNENQLNAHQWTDKRQWYVNTQGQTFAIINADEFLMGPPESELNRNPNETQYRCHIGRRFAISSTDVTKAQFAHFQTARPNVAKPDTSRRVMTDDSPQVAMTWYEAAQYCNWLSEQEGIEEKQWCYEPNEKGDYEAGMKAKDRYLELTGYRLPTEAEWEYACRAGTVTSRYYGLSDTLLVKYAWYEANGLNQTWPVGSLKPNEFGLFDMLGNVWEWCDDLYHPYPPATNGICEDLGSMEPVTDVGSRVLRGGSFSTYARVVRSACRNFDAPAYRDANIGFRPSRTLPLDSP